MAPLKLGQDRQLTETPLSDKSIKRFLDFHRTIECLCDLMHRQNGSLSLDLNKSLKEQCYGDRKFDGLAFGSVCTGNNIARVLLDLLETKDNDPQNQACERLFKAILEKKAKFQITGQSLIVQNKDVEDPVSAVYNLDSYARGAVVASHFEIIHQNGQDSLIVTFIQEGKARLAEIEDGQLHVASAEFLSANSSAIRIAKFDAKLSSAINYRNVQAPILLAFDEADNLLVTRVNKDNFELELLYSAPAGTKLYQAERSESLLEQSLETHGLIMLVNSENDVSVLTIPFNGCSVQETSLGKKFYLPPFLAKVAIVGDQVGNKLINFSNSSPSLALHNPNEIVTHVSKLGFVSGRPGSKTVKLSRLTPEGEIEIAVPPDRSKILGISNDGAVLVAYLNSNAAFPFIQLLRIFQYGQYETLGTVNINKTVSSLEHFDVEFDAQGNTSYLLNGKKLSLKRPS